MTSIVIQFVRLVTPFTRLEKVVNYNRKVQATKFINNEAAINGVHQLNDEIKNIWRSNAQMQDVRCRGFNPKISNASSIRDI